MRTFDVSLTVVLIGFSLGYSCVIVRIRHKSFGSLGPPGQDVMRGMECFFEA